MTFSYQYEIHSYYGNQPPRTKIIIAKVKNDTLRTLLTTGSSAIRWDLHHKLLYSVISFITNI
jgi:hypothetical protein